MVSSTKGGGGHAVPVQLMRTQGRPDFILQVDTVNSLSFSVSSESYG